MGDLIPLDMNENFMINYSVFEGESAFGRCLFFEMCSGCDAGG